MKGACVFTAFRPEAFDSGSLKKEDVLYVFTLRNGVKRHGVPGL